MRRRGRSDADAAPGGRGAGRAAAAAGRLAALVEFAASYYQRSVGELALAVLPPELRRLDATQLARRLKPAPARGRRRRRAAPPPANGPS
jgi:hypothetical protein